MRLVILALTRAFGICPGAVTTMAVVVRLRILTRFISYSHALDGALAQALQTGLERFAKPWYRQRALRVFRDTTNLAASPGLWSSIEEALASSVWLVLMASPEAARSKWVNREVAWWLNNKSPQRLLVVLTEGEFAWKRGEERHQLYHPHCTAPSSRHPVGGSTLVTQRGSSKSVQPAVAGMRGRHRRSRT
jgi:hypothetical protein